MSGGISVCHNWVGVPLATRQRRAGLLNVEHTQDGPAARKYPAPKSVQAGAGSPPGSDRVRGSDPRAPPAIAGPPHGPTLSAACRPAGSREVPDSQGRGTSPSPPPHRAPRCSRCSRRGRCASTNDPGSPGHDCTAQATRQWLRAPSLCSSSPRTHSAPDGCPHPTAPTNAQRDPRTPPPQAAHLLTFGVPDTAS